MTRRFTLFQANAMLPLIHSITAEIRDRVTVRTRLQQRRSAFQDAETPEGLGWAISHLNARLIEIDERLQTSTRELAELGVEIIELQPVTVHIPGCTRADDVVFCWQDGEVQVGFGHGACETESHRRPLLLELETRDAG